MSFGNTFENDLLKLIFNGTAIADIAENDSSGPLTAFYVSLHTADPGEAGSQNTSECAYGSYARVAVNRNSGGWTITGDTLTPTANIDFPTASSGTETATHFGIGTLSSGAGKLLLSGTITPNISISNGVTPRLTTASAATLT